MVDSWKCICCLLFITVGGGTAGSILALRLSEDTNVSVLLIEAGLTAPHILNIPVFGQVKHASELDWQYKTVPQKYSCFGLNENSSVWTSGKALGGSTHLNFMIYLKGHKNDFVTWKDQHSDNWSFDDINYYFNKAAQYVPIDDTSSKNARYSNSKGSVLVRDAVFTTKFSDVVLKSIQEIGYNLTNLNRKGDDGFMRPEVNINKDGFRWTADQALRKAASNRKNLDILTDTVVSGVLIRNEFEAYGIKYRKNGRLRKIHGREEVILSAGAVGSAKLLMLSGIGPEEVLSKAKVRVKIDLPVGKNLQDHIGTGLDLVLVKKTIFSAFDLINPWSAYEYFFNGKGPFTSNMVEAIGLVHSELVDSNEDSPDLQFMILMAGVSSDSGFYSRHSFGISDKLWQEYFSRIQYSVSVIPVLLHPKSIGRIELNPSDPMGPPRIDPNYLHRKSDAETLIKGIRILQKMVNSRVMRDFGASINNLTMPGCEMFEFDTDGYWDCYIRHLTLTIYHPIGTCSMGTLGSSVVDHRLRVHKMNKLRVIDASVMPTLPSANTNAAVAMIAEKGADLIKEDYLGRRSKSSSQEMLLKETKCRFDVV